MWTCPRQQGSHPCTPQGHDDMRTIAIHRVHVMWMQVAGDGLIPDKSLHSSTKWQMPHLLTGPSGQHVHSDEGRVFRLTYGSPSRGSFKLLWTGSICMHADHAPFASAAHQHPDPRIRDWQEWCLPCEFTNRFVRANLASFASISNSINSILYDTSHRRPVLLHAAQQRAVLAEPIHASCIRIVASFRVSQRHCAAPLSISRSCCLCERSGVKRSCRRHDARISAFLTSSRRPCG